MPVTTLLFDVGGVLLTNGWDRHSRRRVVESFDLDYEEFRDRHEFLAHDFEIGQIEIGEYLRRTVFYRDRDFTEPAFVAAMQRQSTELAGSMALVEELAGRGLFLATLNNESRALNEYRIDAFGLRRYFKTFLSSCYLGVKKPEPEIYHLAFSITQASPAEVLFIDDRSLNIECAADQGLTGILFESADQLRRELSARGVAT